MDNLNAGFSMQGQYALAAVHLGNAGDGNDKLARIAIFLCHNVDSIHIVCISVRIVNNLHTVLLHNGGYVDSAIHLGYTLDRYFVLGNGYCRSCLFLLGLNFAFGFCNLLRTSHSEQRFVEYRLHIAVDSDNVIIIHANDNALIGNLDCITILSLGFRLFVIENFNELGFRLAIKKSINKLVDLCRCSFSTAGAGHFKKNYGLFRLFNRLFTKNTCILNGRNSNESRNLRLGLVCNSGIVRLDSRGGYDSNIAERRCTCGTLLLGSFFNKLSNAFCIRLDSLFLSALALRLFVSIGKHCSVIFERLNHLFINYKHILSNGLTLKRYGIRLFTGNCNRWQFFPLNHTEIVINLNGFFHLNTVRTCFRNSAFNHGKRNNYSKENENHTYTKIDNRIGLGLLCGIVAAGLYSTATNGRHRCRGILYLDCNCINREVRNLELQIFYITRYRVGNNIKCVNSVTSVGIVINDGKLTRRI